MTERPARRPRLRTVLLVVNLAILILPIVGIASLRLYENELIRGTEAQLLVQGAVLREVFLDAFRRVATASPAPLGSDAGAYPSPAPPDALMPTLDINERPPRPAAAPAGIPPEPAEPNAAKAGEIVRAALALSSRTTLAGVRIVDVHGTVVASSGTELGLSLADREEVSRALRGDTASLLRVRTSEFASPPLESLSRGQRYRVFVALPVRDAGRVVGVVVLSRTPLDVAKALFLNRKPILVGVAVLLGVVLLVTAITSLAISRPLRALVAQAERVERGEPGPLGPIPRPGTHEVAQLSLAFAGMAKTLQERAEYIRTFASHVSHEFKTPLTTLRGSLELLRDHGASMSADERARFLSNAEEASTRLDRLVRRLLDLARADVARPGDGESDVGALLAAVADRYRSAGLKIVAEVAASAGRARIAPDTLEEILSNLVDNARQHGGTDVTVRLMARRDAGPPAVVEIVVEDDGPGISEANRPRIFTPFFTTARDRGGSGLGLSIVRALVEAHGGLVDAEGAGPGARFRIRIPAPPLC